MIEKTNFGEMMKRFRKRGKISQRVLAQRMSVHYNTIWSWERGDYLPETRGLVLELARQLSLTEQETQALLEASLISVSTYWHIPFPRNAFFVGRDAILARIHSCLQQDVEPQHLRFCGLSGLAGIGKTQIALEYAYRHRHSYSGLFWLDAETQEASLTSYISLAYNLHLTIPEHHDSSTVVSQVHHWLITHKEWLLIIDNVEDVDLMTSLLPAAPHGSIIMTTRRSKINALAPLFEIEPLSPAESTSLLLYRAGLTVTPNATVDGADTKDISAVQALVEAMEGLPLALDQAGAYIEATQCRLSDFRSLFFSFPATLLHERENAVHHPRSVVHTFLAAFQRVQQSSPLASELLIFCSLLSPSAIPEEIFTRGTAGLSPLLTPFVEHPLAFNSAISLLRSYSLIKRSREDQTLSIHRLLQLILRSQIEASRLREYEVQIVQTINALFIDPFDEGGWTDCQRLFTQASHCATFIDQWQQVTTAGWQLLARLSRYLLESRQMVLAKTLINRRHALLKQFQGEMHVETAVCLLDLGEVYALDGDYDQAEQICRQAIAVLQQVQQHETLEMAHGLHNLGAIALFQRNIQDAEHFHRQALMLRERLLGSQAMEVANSLEHLGYILRNQGLISESKNTFAKVSEIISQTCGSQHYRIADILIQVGICDGMQGEYARAEEQFQQARAIFLQFWGPESVQISICDNNLAKLAFRQGKYEQAETLYLRAIDLRERLLGKHHPDLFTLIANLIELYKAQQQFHQAYVTYPRLLEIGTHVFGPDHEQVIVQQEHYTKLIQEHPTCIEKVT